MTEIISDYEKENNCRITNISFEEFKTNMKLTPLFDIPGIKYFYIILVLSEMRLIDRIIGYSRYIPVFCFLWGALISYVFHKLSISSFIIVELMTAGVLYFNIKIFDNHILRYNLENNKEFYDYMVKSGYVRIYECL